MSGKSKHYGDVIMWITSVIDSCESPEQISVVNRLIENFSDLYCRDTNSTFPDSKPFVELRQRTHEKLRDIYSQKKND